MLIFVKALRNEPSRLAKVIKQKILNNPLKNEIIWRNDSLRALIADIWIEPSLPCLAENEIELRILTGLDAVSRKIFSRHTFGIPVLLLSNWANEDCVEFSSSLIDLLCYYAKLKLGMLVKLNGVEPMELLFDVLFINQQAILAQGNRITVTQISQMFGIPISDIEARPKLFYELYRLMLPKNIDELMYLLYHQVWNPEAYKSMNYNMRTFVNCISLLKCSDACLCVGAGGCRL